METKLIYVETDSTDVYTNFGYEYYFATEKKLPGTVFLLWRTDPTLMVGKYQNIFEEINMPYARAHQLKLVRRLSGGGTIYTDRGGWQFSFIVRDGEHPIAFQRYLEPVLSALNRMGIAAGFNGRNDLTVEGKKFSGNAQYHLHGTTVHHGSLLFDTDIEAMVNSTTVDPYKILSKSIKSVRERVTNLSEHLPVSMSAEEFKQTLLSYIFTEGDTYHCNAEDLQRIEALAEEHFRSWDSIYGKSPQFSIQKENHLKGGLFKASLNVEAGRISEIEFSGDFFSAVDLNPLKAALQGTAFDRDAILQVLLDYQEKKGSLLYNITPQEMADTIAL